MPDLQDQVAATGIFQVGELNGSEFRLHDIDRIRLAADIDEHIDRSDVKPQRAAARRAAPGLRRWRTAGPP